MEPEGSLLYLQESVSITKGSQCLLVFMSTTKPWDGRTMRNSVIWFRIRNSYIFRTSLNPQKEATD